MILKLKNISVTNTKAFIWLATCKYFNGYKDDRKGKPLCITFPKINTYKGDFDETKSVFFDKR